MMRSETDGFAKTLRECAWQAVEMTKVELGPKAPLVDRPERRMIATDTLVVQNSHRRVISFV